LISWCDKKVLACQDEVRELWDARERAKKMKWKWEPLHNLWRNSSRRLAYYEKVKAALNAGFYIVPNFDIQMFAIRTKKKTPKDNWVIGSFADHKKEAQELPAGEGEYQNPFPVVYEKYIADGNERKRYHRADHWDTMEFPIMMAKPAVMDACSRAMALKVFDRIGVFPNHRKEDPVIIGQIFTKRGYNERIVSFMIAWHLDTRVI